LLKRAQFLEEYNVESC